MPLAPRRSGQLRVPLLRFARRVRSLLRLPWRARLSAGPGTSARTRSPNRAQVRSAGSSPARGEAFSVWGVRCDFHLLAFFMLTGARHPLSAGLLKHEDLDWTQGSQPRAAQAMGLAVPEM